MNLIEKLNKIQVELKAPKGQMNKFGGYKYRSCEDILESVKPLLDGTKTALTIADELVQIGDRYYVKATAILRDSESKDLIENSAFAREEEIKKGMDSSQITGAASSYARKYALNGLLAIDDTKDADATNDHGKKEPVTEEELAEKEQEKILKRKINDIELEAFNEAVKETNTNTSILFKLISYNGKPEDMTFGTWKDVMTRIEQKKAKMKKPETKLDL